jgi:hypothetical protein
LPIVKCTAVKPIVSKHGTNYQPVLAIVGWVERPAELTINDTPQPTQSPPPPMQMASHAEQLLDDDVPF